MKRLLELGIITVVSFSIVIVASFFVSKLVPTIEQIKPVAEVLVKGDI